MKTICVFGGSGFLGSHVADVLSRSGYKVRIFDRKKSNWLQIEQDMILGDLLNLEEVNEAVRGCDAVYNFAGLSDLNEALEKPLDSISINILGNANVLEACRKNAVRRFIYASTVYVHSREGGFYRCSKQSAESYVQEYQRVYDLDYTILRYGSLYGPRSDKANGLYRILFEAIKTGVVRYYGYPEALREYIHVDDAARASVVALGDQFKNESVVLTGHEPMRVLDLLEMISEILGLKDAVEFIPSDQLGHYVRTPYAYQDNLGRKYIPPMHVDLGQGILQLIADIKSRSDDFDEK
jgi:UDP-glucose 4-epimerase